jgi:hypothetical protein
VPVDGGYGADAEHAESAHSPCALTNAQPLLTPQAPVPVDGGYGADADDDELAPPEAWALADALHLACALCCEMALGDGATCGSAAHLLEVGGWRKVMRVYIHCRRSQSVPKHMRET